MSCAFDLSLASSGLGCLLRRAADGGHSRCTRAGSSLQRAAQRDGVCWARARYSTLHRGLCEGWCALLDQLVQTVRRAAREVVPQAQHPRALPQPLQALVPAHQLHQHLEWFNDSAPELSTGAALAARDGHTQSNRSTGGGGGGGGGGGVWAHHASCSEMSVRRVPSLVTSPTLRLVPPTQMYSPLEKYATQQGSYPTSLSFPTCARRAATQ
jgi:hypothetical protein